MSEVQTEIQSVIAAEEIIVSAELKNIIETLIFASDEPMTVRFIRSIMDEANKNLSPDEQIIVNAEIIRKAVGDLNRGYGRMGSGFRIIEIAGGFTFATKDEYAPWVGKLAKEKARRRLSPTAVETLAIIAYKQPIAKGEVEFIRGVNVDYIINALLEKDLIQITGRAHSPGRPLLYGTTQKFLEHFGLNELSDLPKPREIAELINETEAEVDRRLLEEQQELEFREDLEKKLEGTEGSKNKPSKQTKIKVPDQVKEELKAEQRKDQMIAPLPAAEAAEIPQNGNGTIQESDVSGTVMPEQQEQLIGEGEIISESSGNISAAVEEAEPMNGVPLVENPVENPSLERADLLMDEKELPKENLEMEIVTPEVPREIVPEAPVRHEVIVEEAVRSEETRENEEPFRQDREESEGAGETGWSKWKNKVKTFFRKLFA